MILNVPSWLSMRLYFLSKKGGGGVIFQVSKSNLAIVKKKIKWNRITYSHASWIPNLINPHPHWYLMCQADFQWSYITNKKKGGGGAIFQVSKRNLARHYLHRVVKKKNKWNRITYSHASWIPNLINPHPLLSNLLTSNAARKTNPPLSCLHVSKPPHYLPQRPGPALKCRLCLFHH